jgi:hypothetical protein
MELFDGTKRPNLRRVSAMGVTNAGRTLRIVHASSIRPSKDSPMDSTRTRNIVAHAATAAALLVCVAVIAGFGRMSDPAPAELGLMAKPDVPVWTTSAVESAPAFPDAETATPAAVVADLPPPIVINDVGQIPLAEAPAVEPGAGVVGLWAPDAGSCSLRSFRQGLLPTIINSEGAWAGETFCVFKSRKQSDTGWRVVADCSSGNDHWTTQVRLSLKGERLIWESKRGRQVYSRCGPDVRMAAAP